MAEQAQNPAAPAAVPNPPMQAPKPARPVSLFTIPRKLAQETGVTQVGLITLTADEELAAYSRGRKDTAKIAAELAQAALVEVDGQKLSLHDGSAESAWKKLDPRVRQLIMTAYAELHGADDEDQESFLKSRQTRVG